MIPLSPTLAHQVQRPHPLGSKQDGGLSFAPSAGTRAGVGDAKARSGAKGSCDQRSGEEIELKGPSLRIPARCRGLF